MPKFLVELSDDQWIVTDDDPDYDGPETNVFDDIDVYHIEAASASEAIDIAEMLKSEDEDGSFVLDDFDRDPD